MSAMEERKQVEPRHRPGRMALANTIVKGPDSLSWSDNHGDEFNGWAVLGLRRRDSDFQRVESRLVFADPFDEAQNLALLRVVQWNVGQTRPLMKAADYRVSLPRRAVVIDAVQLWKWLVQLEAIHVPIAHVYQRMDESQVRSLLVQREYVSSRLEITWQHQLKEFAELNRVWASIWEEMDALVATRVEIEEVREQYWSNNPTGQYIHSGYEASWRDYWSSNT